MGPHHMELLCTYGSIDIRYSPHSIVYDGRDPLMSSMWYHTPGPVLTTAAVNGLALARVGYIGKMCNLISLHAVTKRVS